MARRDRSLEILSRLAMLERLEFWAIPGITDAGVKALARLPRLREISMGGSSRVTRAGMAQFAAHVRVTHHPVIPRAATTVLGGGRDDTLEDDMMIACRARSSVG